MEQKIKCFLDQICVELGICLPLNEKERLMSKIPSDVDEFVREILIAEQLDPDLELDLYRQVKRRFVERFSGVLR